MFIYCICTQYLVGAPFALITVSIRRGMEVISLWHCWGGMEAQVSLTVAFSSSAFFWSLVIISSWQYLIDSLRQWFSNFLHQVPPQKIFGFPSTTIMTNIKMQYKWLPTAPGVCSRCVCVCVHCCVCVCVHFGWVKCRAQIPSMSRHFHF